MPTLSPAQIATAARAGGFTGSQVPIMVAIAMGESGGQTEITHHNNDGSTDYGTWQINSVHSDILSIGDWRDPAINGRMAYMVYKQQGYQAWSVFNSKGYISHLSLAQSASGQTATLPTVTPAGTTTTGGAASNLLANPHTYLRVGMFILGWMLVQLSLVFMGWGNLPGSAQTIVKAVALKKMPIPKGVK